MAILTSRPRAAAEQEGSILRPFLIFAVAALAGAPAAALPLSPEPALDGPINSGSGGVFYDDFTGTLTEDFIFDPLVIDAGPLASSTLEFFFGGPDDIAALVAPDDSRLELDVIASGFTESGPGDELQLLLNGGAGLPNGALLVLSSPLFDFSGADPLTFFAQQAALNPSFPEFAAPATFTLQSLAAPGEPGAAPVPLPAAAPLLTLGLLTLVRAARRRPRRFDP
ncbi:MAG: hypothetical protein AAF763_06080 [Pseudomonadota bacterium]